MNEKPLSFQQIRVCQEYLKDYNWTQACIRAGYSDNQHTIKETVKRLSHDPRIIAAIIKYESERTERTNVDLDWWLAEAVAQYIGAKGTGDKKNALKYFTMIGRHLGAFVDRSESTVKHVFTEEDKDLVEDFKQRAIRAHEAELARKKEALH